MSYSYDRFESQNRRQTYGASSTRTAFGYWVPLVLTVTAASIGIAAWIWKERGDDEEVYEREKRDDKPPPGYGDVGPGHTAYGPDAQPLPSDDPSFIARMSGALRRTPSPQQIFDEAGRRVAAGVAAAGAAVGGALSSIQEEDKGDFEDHSRWSEEAAVRAGGAVGLSATSLGQPSSMFANLSSQAPVGPKVMDKRKTVAIVVSGENRHHGTGIMDANYLQEHASILSHLPEHIDNGSRVFIMIYAPTLEQHPLSTIRGTRPVASITSSYSNIGHEDLQTSADGDDGTGTAQSQSFDQNAPHLFNALYSQAQALVEKDTMIMPFTSPTGYVHLLRHIAPEVVYVQSTLAGIEGEAVKHIAGWVGQVVLVVGDDSGHGGLVDSEDEHAGAGEESRQRWWHDDPKIGLGKGIEVVEGLRVGEDWRRRVRGHD